MARVLILSDRAEDLAVLASELEAGGHRVSSAPLDGAADPECDVILVDTAKDLGSGRDVCRALHRANPRRAVLAIVSPDTIGAVGPDWGVDSFVLDGASAEETLARIRIARGAQVAESETTIRVGDLAIDPETYQVRLRGRPLDLTYKEFQLLAFLATKPGRVFSRAQLLQEVWGYDFFGGTRTVDVHVRRLRAKLGAEHEALIATVRNVGYKVEPPARGRA